MARRNTPKIIETLRHESASRRNIPTAEHEPVMAADDRTPIAVAYERRNRDLDPQLVWRGKDQQNWSDLVVQAPPLFIQEKIHPQALINDLLRHSRTAEAERLARQFGSQTDLFADFNGLPDGGRPHRVLPARGQLEQPHDPGGQPASDGVPGGAGRVAGPGAVHLS